MPMNRALYSDDWEEITAKLKDEVGQRCEQCGAPNNKYINRRLDNPVVWMEAFTDQWEQVLYFESEEWADEIKVILTTAHLDHNPRNNDRLNLRVLCQRCHLVYDSPHHQINARRTRISKKHQAKVQAGQLLIFSSDEP